MALCKIDVSKIYNLVIEDVTSAVREIFADEGINEEVLQELIRLWKSKLLACNTFTPVEPNETESVSPPEDQPQQQSNNQVQTVAVQVDPKMVPIKITIPIDTSTNSPSRILTIHVPDRSLKDPTLHKILTGPLMATTMGLPDAVAAAVVQQHVDATLKSQQQLINLSERGMPQLDGSTDTERKKKSKTTVELVLCGTDGASDTSDDDASEDDIDEEEVEEEEEDGGLGDEEPLNSSDDISDEDMSDMFETDNVVVCRYDKIIRAKNKWKLYLIHGIMNLEGLDYIFSKASGQADW